ncbi:discoidin domain-containing protein [Lentzea kentuckyensis]|uniref:discoidin domain-containing protein n=1 Tax=Lentzea kentuckyensis TaxID=360086 RepID=UPI001B80E5C4|nr:discoidin domain-containing protein [Lentzea kentuckyensis]
MKRRPLVRPVFLALIVIAAAVVPQVAKPEHGEGGAHDHHQRLEIAAAAMVPGAPKLPRDGWVATASSEESTADNPAARVLDGDRATIWHSRWRTATSLPQWVTIDMRTVQRVSGLVYTPRSDRKNGRIGRYEIRLSSDGGTWGAPIVTGTMADDETVKTIGFAVSSARYVRLVALSEAGDRGPWASAAEIDLLGDPGLPPPAQGDPSVAGSWGPTVGFPLVPAASAVLPGNKLLTWSAYTTDNFGGANGYTQTAIMDLTTGQVSRRQVDNTGHDMFCPGTSMLADGRILVTGGSDATKTSIYDPRTDAWSSAPDMTVGRGYQGQTTLSTGEVFTVGGSWSGGRKAKAGELYSPKTNQWRSLPGVSAAPFLTADPAGVYRADNHAWLFAASGGRVFHAGPSAAMHWVDTAGQGKVTDAGARGDSRDAMNGNAVMYDIGKILTLGGAPAYEKADATNAAYTVDITGRMPVVRRTADMAAARAYVNSVVLPDGTVMVVGGQSYPVPFSDQTSVLVPELWNPATGKFTKLAAMATPRNYHSVANLLPDGTVFSGGGGLCGKCATNHPDGQIFVPPYLLNPDGSRKPRPAITSAPAVAANGATVTIGTDRAVKGFSLVRVSAVTHSVDNDQRRVPLSSTAVSPTSHRVVIPADPGIALPGNYLLFALDNAGTPSVAAQVRIGG